nr:hypothetical protein [Evansella caseinilytica]
MITAIFFIVAPLKSSSQECDSSSPTWSSLYLDRPRQWQPLDKLYAPPYFAWMPLMQTRFLHTVPTEKIARHKN